MADLSSHRRSSSTRRNSWTSWLHGFRRDSAPPKREDIAYEQLSRHSSYDDSETDLSLSLEELESSTPKRSKACLADRLLLAVFSTSLLGLVITIAFRFSPLQERHFQVSCLERFSAFSPALKGVKQEWLQYDPDDIGSQFVGESRDELDEAWKALTLDNRVHFGLDAQSLPRLNKTNSDIEYVREFGKTNGQIVARAEVFHQLHCVNMLREYIYRAPAEQDIEVGTDEFLYRMHMDHCLLVLQTNVRCMSDVSPVVFRKDQDDVELWKPYTAPHLCRDLDVTRDWMRAHKVNFTTGSHPHGP